MVAQPAELNAVLWSRTAAEQPQWRTLASNCVAEVAVVGAGFTGLTAALQLAESGCRVVVLEAGVPGVGASGRCAGFVVPNLARADPAVLQNAYGKRQGRRLAKLIGDGANKVFAAAEKVGVPESVVRTGWIQPVVGRASLAAARGRFEQWRDLDQPVDWLDATSAEAATGLSHLSGAWRDNSAGVMQPLDYLRGLARAIERAGGAIYTHSPVRALTRDGECWRLTTANAAVRAERVLVCTNGIGFQGLADLSRSVLSVTVYQIATKPLSARQRARLEVSGCAVSDTRRNIFTYRFDNDQRLITGGIALLDTGAGQHMGQSLLRRLAHELKLSPAPELESLWCGRMAVTRDFLPHLHQPAPGVWAGVGCNGRGIAMTAVLGEIMAQAALDNDAGSIALPVTPLRPIVWRRFLPASMAVKGNLALGRVRDYLDRRQALER